MLKSKFRRIILEIIDKSILLHAPFLKNKSNIGLILKGWDEYLVEYLKKKNFLRNLGLKLGYIYKFLDNENINN